MSSRGSEAGGLAQTASEMTVPPPAGSSRFRHAWDRARSLRDGIRAGMGLAMDLNKALPLGKRKVLTWQRPGPPNLAGFQYLVLPIIFLVRFLGLRSVAAKSASLH